MPIKLVPKQFEVLVERVRDSLNRLRQQERAIMQLCVRDARMPRADFLRMFPSNETDQTWSGDWPSATPSGLPPRVKRTLPSSLASRS